MNLERFSSQNAAMLLIDHQVGTMSWVRSAPLEEIKRNTVVLAKAARALNLPVILTTSMEEQVQGPLMPEVQAILPEAFAVRIKRLGVVDACGSPSKIADDIALRRMEKAGVTLTSTNQMIAELARKWTTLEGGKLIEILFKDVISKLGPA